MKCTLYFLTLLIFPLITMNAQQIDQIWSVDGHGTYVFAGAENMDDDPQVELLYVQHNIGVPTFNPRIVIFDGLDGTVQYDSGSSLMDNYYVAGFNWTTTSGSNINTGRQALHDVDDDGIYELVYNRNGQFNEVLKYDGSSFSTLWSADDLGTYVLIGAENMDNDPQLELVFLEHLIGENNYNRRLVIFDGLDGTVEYDSGPGIDDHYNVAGFNWTTSDGNNINTGFNALFDVDADGRHELVYNVNGQTNQVLGFDGNDFTIDWAENSLGTFVLIGAGNMDVDPQLELVFLRHETGVTNYNPRVVIFDGMDGSIDYDTGPGIQQSYNLAGFNWTTSTGLDINMGFDAIFDVDSDGLDELVYNLNGTTNEVVGFDGTSLSLAWSQNAEGTIMLLGAENMDDDFHKEIVFAEHQTGIINFNPRIVIFDGMDGTVEYDTGPGAENTYNIAGFNWTTSGGLGINMGFDPLVDTDSDGQYELVYNINGDLNEVLGYGSGDFGVEWSVDAMGTFIFIGAENLDTDAAKELVFVEQDLDVPVLNPRMIIFDGADGSVEYDSGPGSPDQFNVAGFNWTTSSGSYINNGFNPFVDVDHDGRYELTFNVNGDDNKLLGWGLVSVKEPSFVDNPLSVNVYPNPGTEQVLLSVNMPFPQDIEIKIFDLLGNEVDAISPDWPGKGVHEIMLPVKEYTEGLYFVTVYSEYGTLSKKLIVR